MLCGKLIKLGVPRISKVTTGSEAVAVVNVRHKTGQCGIDPYKPSSPPPPPVPEKFPDHLLRPPCLSGDERGRFPPQAMMQGFYCPPQRIKYKYPPFSDNIDFVPSGDADCWWIKTTACNVHHEDEELPIKLP